MAGLRTAQMPPAVFAPILGLLGLGLAWRRASAVWGVPDAMGELILGASAGLWLFAAVSYGLKVWQRPGVLAEDAAALPGRAGLAAAGLGGLALALGLVPYAPVLARGLLLLTLAWQAGFAVLVLRLIFGGPPEGRRVTPVWLLTFVGFILGPLVAAPLGWSGLAVLLLALMLPVAAAIHLVSLRQLWQETPIPPLRPLLVIHLAPISLGGLGLGALGIDWAAALLALLASGLALALLASLRWITAAGFTPFWGAFTFPVAAYANLLGLMAGLYPWVQVAALPVLALATVAVPWIAIRILRLWAGGRLGEMTGAARA
ncbi:tellurium resistance protein [Frigidibacter sp. ROC022]|uniref:SLAC1 family transporter n=1 Tax=Frigidibacter sp. ROC022 TaxID=2971796 RepID=UPI00215AB5DC|nr:tellurium resistance protein [Frigidibacter sp. ROC022]MCR8723794.1 tellurium resistance protein [Frigidibacter sp. ROC022]